MKLISIGTDQKIFEEGSAVQKRQIEYGKLFEESHLIIFNNKIKSVFERMNISGNVFVYPTNSKSKISGIFDALKTIKAISSKPGCGNIVISTQDPFETGLVGLLSKLFYGLPLHVQLHTDFNNKYFVLHSPLNTIRFLLAHIVLPYADSVRCVSEKVANSVRELNPKVSVLPISQVFNVENISLKKEFKARLITICRLEKEKDLETAIKAFKKLSEFYPEATFTIVGDGSQRKSLELMARSLDLEDKIKFVGWQNNPSDFYREADIYISTSLFEGYGLSMVEAALYNLPLVLSDAGIAEEYFRNKGALICDPKDESGFYRSLSVLFKDKEARLMMGEEARKSVESKIIPWNKYLDLYKE